MDKHDQLKYDYTLLAKTIDHKKFLKEFEKVCREKNLVKASGDIRRVMSTVGTRKAKLKQLALNCGRYYDELLTQASSEPEINKKKYEITALAETLRQEIEFHGDLLFQILKKMVEIDITLMQNDRTALQNTFADCGLTVRHSLRNKMMDDYGKKVRIYKLTLLWQAIEKLLRNFSEEDIAKNIDSLRNSEDADGNLFRANECYKRILSAHKLSGRNDIVTRNAGLYVKLLTPALEERKSKKLPGPHS